MSVRNRTSALFGSALVALVVLLAGLGATNSFGWVTRDRDVVTSTPTPTPTPTASSTPTGGPQASSGVPDKDPILVRDQIMPLVAGVAFLLMAFVLWRAIRQLLSIRRRRDRERAAAEEADEIDAIDDAELAAALQTSAQGTLEALVARRISGRDAVIRAWRGFVAAGGERGLQRLPADTSTDYTARVLARGGVDAEAVEDLAGLYRDTMFGPRAPTEADAERASDCLGRIVAQLERRGSPRA